MDQDCGWLLAIGYLVPVILLCRLHFPCDDSFSADFSLYSGDLGCGDVFPDVDHTQGLVNTVRG
jgi:hypothetical protein